MSTTETIVDKDKVKKFLKSAGHFYLGLALQSRAKHSVVPQADLQSAISAYRAVLEVRLDRRRRGARNQPGHDRLAVGVEVHSAVGVVIDER